MTVLYLDLFGQSRVSSDFFKKASSHTRGNSTLRSDSQCMMGKTDENGVASFAGLPGSYTVHLLKVPEGFAKDSSEYSAPSVPGDMTIVVKAA